LTKRFTDQVSSVAHFVKTYIQFFASASKQYQTTSSRNQSGLTNLYSKAS